MLVLTRKLNQQIHLGDDITITVLRVRGNTIRLGIDAPRSTRVVRGELPPLTAAEVKEKEDAVVPARREGHGEKNAPKTLHSGPRQPRVTASASNAAKPLAQFVSKSAPLTAAPVLA